MARNYGSLRKRNRRDIVQSIIYHPPRAARIQHAGDGLVVGAGRTKRLLLHFPLSFLHGSPGAGSLSSLCDRPRRRPELNLLLPAENAAWPTRAFWATKLRKRCLGPLLALLRLLS